MAQYTIIRSKSMPNIKIRANEKFKFIINNIWERREERGIKESDKNGTIKEK